MYKEHRILAIIPARGGSKGIPHKNIVKLCGKPLIAYSIEAGLASKYIDYVMVSTDDLVIADVSKSFGAHVPFLRPAELASDESKTIDVIIHALRTLRYDEGEYDSLVLLQPTQPLRTGTDIDLAIEKFYSNNQKSLVSVCKVREHPILIRSIQNDRVVKLLDASSTCRRQDMPEYYRVNGCIYINQIKEINEYTSFNDNIVPFIMHEDHSVDIDDMSDLNLAEFYLCNKDR